MTLFTSVIVRFLLTGLNLLAFAGFEVVAGAAAQTDDLAKGLVGRWEGQVEGLRRTTEQTLVIESLAKEGETWSVTGVMGSPERRFGAFRGTLERAGGDLVLRFNRAGATQRRSPLPSPQCARAAVKLVISQPETRRRAIVGLPTGRRRGARPASTCTELCDSA